MTLPLVGLALSSVATLGLILWGSSRAAAAATPPASPPNALVGQVVKVPWTAVTQVSLVGQFPPVAGPALTDLPGAAQVRITAVSGNTLTGEVVSASFSTVAGVPLPPGLSVSFSKDAVLT